MTTMMSTMKDDMLQQFEDYFGHSKPEINESPHSNPEQDSNNVAAAIDTFFLSNEPNDTSGGFDDLAAEFSTTDKIGPAVDAKLTDMVNDLLQNPLLKAKLEELVTKYPSPENCQSLVAPKINKMVWQKLKLMVLCSDVKNCLILQFPLQLNCLATISRRKSTI